MSQLLEKLQNYKTKLLDMGKRNRLLNFKATKTSSLRILQPEMDTLCAKLTSNSVLQARYIIKEENQRVCDRDILFDSNELEGKSVLYKLRAKATSSLEEQGVNSLYIAVGFLEWKETPSSDCTFKSPILLLPITVRLDSIYSPYSISLYEDEMIVNPSLKYKLKESFKIELPDFGDDIDETVSEYLSRILPCFAGSGFTISNESYLGIFSFAKLNMYMDIHTNMEQLPQNPLICALCGEPSELLGIIGEDEIALDTAMTHENNYCVVDADSSQLHAVYNVQNGKSFVLQGPPGTGKSQTITNIIASCLAAGKKVLFVSEKMAALNVVFNNLKKAGLEDFCLQLHSHKANKKEVIGELCETLATAKTAVPKGLHDELNELEEKKLLLNRYASILKMPIEVLGITVFELFSNLAKYMSAKQVSYSIGNISAISKVQQKTMLALLKEYTAFTGIIGKNYKSNPHYGYCCTDKSYEQQCKTESIYRQTLSSISEYELAIAELKKALDIRFLDDLSEEYSQLEFLELLRECGQPEDIWFNCENNALLCQRVSVLSENILSFHRAKQITDHVESDLYSEDTTKMLKDFKYSYSGFFRGLNSSYRRGMKLIRLNTLGLGEKIAYEKAVEILRAIEEHKSAVAYFSENGKEFKESLGERYAKENTDCTAVLTLLQKIRDGKTLFDRYTGDKFISCLCEGEKGARTALIEAFDKKYEQLKECYRELNRLIQKNVFNFGDRTFSEVRDKLNAGLFHLNNLTDWVNFYILFTKMEENHLINFLDGAILAGIPNAEIEEVFLRRFYYLWADELSRREETLHSFTREKQDELVEIFAQKDRLQLKIAQSRIKELLSALRPNTNIISQDSEVAVLKREGEKKRKLMPIRRLFSAIPNLLYRLKPCLLMSPMSVSLYLPQTIGEFDTVIFDEASQIFPEDALNSVYRAKQLIIVGDSQQLPPTNFFNAVANEDAFDDSEDYYDDVFAYESILDVGSSFLSRIRLKWHYRSKFEELIAFSNSKIYNGELITFPSPLTDIADTGVEYINVVGGVYDRSGKRCNPIEAETVAMTVIKQFEKYPDRSLGVVAFSEAQAEAVDNAILEIRKKDARFEGFFDENRSERFFVKNIESVQGDERDTIIFSVGYGRDKNGKMYQNFGPLSTEGGERRLNVAITRAKVNIKIISSILPTDIDASNAKQGVKLLKSYMEFARGSESFDCSSANDTDELLIQSVAKVLAKNGYVADIKLGSSEYKIDIAVRHPKKPNVYVLGVECDGETYYNSRTARDRDRTKSDALKRLNWRLYRIWSTDWIKRGETESAKLVKAVADAVFAYDNFEKAAELRQVEERIFELPIRERDSYGFETYRIAKLSDFSEQSIPSKIAYVLDIESPICEELLLKRVCPLFNREKVTTAVRDEFRQQWRICEKMGLYYNNGYYFLSDNQKPVFRIPMQGDENRKIEQICEGELQCGIVAVVKESVGISESGIIAEVSRLLGYKRITESISRILSQMITNTEKLGLIEKKNGMYTI